MLVDRVLDAQADGDDHEPSRLNEFSAWFGDIPTNRSAARCKCKCKRECKCDGDGDGENDVVTHW